MTILVVHSPERATQLRSQGDTRRLVIVRREATAWRRMEGLSEPVEFDDLFDQNVGKHIAAIAREIAVGCNKAAISQGSQ